MSDDVKRYRLSYRHGVVSAENDARFFPDSSQPMVLASDHDRIVSSLRAENAALEISVAEAGGAFELCDRENERLRAEVESLGKDARRYRFWRVHQYNGMLDLGELCDPGSPQAVHFDRLTDSAIEKPE